VPTGRVTVRDLRLRGASGVRHQIDAVVGDEHKRIRSRPKDCDKVIGLPIIRHFWCAVEDIGPAEAFVVTTVGHQAGDPVRRGEGHPPCAAASAEEEDGTGVYRKVGLDITMTGQAGLANVTRQLHPDATTRPTARTWGSESPRPHSSSSPTQTAKERDFLPIFDAQLAEDNGMVPLGGEATIGRVKVFDEPTWLIAPGVPPLRVEAWLWELKVASDAIQVVIGDGIGDLVAELALRTIDGSIRRMFTNRRLEAWTFDGHNVIPPAG
jgi:hypothetical protein